jgi:hypothetical protein
MVLFLQCEIGKIPLVLFINHLGEILLYFLENFICLPLVYSGTIEGSIIIVGSKDMRTLVTVKKAHLGIVTTLAFSQDSRLVSLSSELMNLNKKKKKKKRNKEISQCSCFTSFQNIAVNFL